MRIDLLKELAVGAEAASSVKATVLAGSLKRVIFCGMGGSIIPAEMLSMLWLDNFNYYLQRDFGLPFWADRDCLVICLSWSGDTEETISSFSSAINKNIPAIAITKGGKLEKLAMEAKYPLVILPPDSRPARFGAVRMLGALLTLLKNSASIDYNLPDDLNVLGSVGPEVAPKIVGKIPLVYSSYQWRFLARFWKIQFNENCKIQAFCSYLPEATHNEIAGFSPENNQKFFPIVIADSSEGPENNIEKFVNFLKNVGQEHTVINLHGHSRIEKILSNYLDSIQVSTELCQILGIDPLDNSVIDSFKI
jgi:glucose/mannose-6-phosphate isomerase